jgi:hypothetical protein
MGLHLPRQTAPLGAAALVLVKKQLRFFGPVLNIVTPNLFFNEDLSAEREDVFLVEIRFYDKGVFV